MALEGFTSAEVEIVGICRFAMIGVGDWKAFRKRDENTDLEAIYAEQRERMFNEDRLKERLYTFEHITLKSLSAQTDHRFKFVVFISEELPEWVWLRFQTFEAEFPFLSVWTVPPMHISEAIRTLKLGPKVVQFRLDDDDAVAMNYIEKLRQTMWANPEPVLAYCHSTQIYCITDGPTAGYYEWYSPFFSAGLAIRHPKKTVYDFAHYKVPTRMKAIMDPTSANIVMHLGNNDTPRHEAQILRKRGMIKLEPHKKRYSQLMSNHCVKVEDAVSYLMGVHNVC